MSSYPSSDCATDGSAKRYVTQAILSYPSFFWTIISTLPFHKSSTLIHCLIQFLAILCLCRYQWQLLNYCYSAVLLYSAYHDLPHRTYLADPLSSQIHPTSCSVPYCFDADMPRRLRSHYGDPREVITYNYKEERIRIGEAGMKTGYVSPKMIHTQCP
jgi:hypothetical protein